MHHHCLTQIQQNLGDANRKSGKVASQFGKLFCDNLLPAEFFFFFGGGRGVTEQEQASCFTAVWLINCNIRHEIYASNI